MYTKKINHQITVKILKQVAKKKCFKNNKNWTIKDCQKE
jgi:hypothetical protein